MPDCTTVRGFNVAIDRVPRHGVVELEKTTAIVDESFLRGGWSRAHHPMLVRRCMGRELPVIVVLYTSNPRYAGFDDMRMVVTTPNRQRQRMVELRIAVR